MTWFITSRIGNVVGLLLLAGIVYGGIYAKGRIDEKSEQRARQLERNDAATKERKAIDRAVPRTPFDDRVDELR